jgi:hypothetical protein
LKNGFILVEKPCAAQAIENRKVAFLYNRYIGMLELLEGRFICMPLRNN